MNRPFFEGQRVLKIFLHPFSTRLLSILPVTSTLAAAPPDTRPGRAIVCPHVTAPNSVPINRARNSYGDAFHRARYIGPPQITARICSTNGQEEESRSKKQLFEQHRNQGTAVEACHLHGRKRCRGSRAFDRLRLAMEETAIAVVMITSTWRKPSAAAHTWRKSWVVSRDS